MMIPRLSIYISIHTQYDIYIYTHTVWYTYTHIYIYVIPGMVGSTWFRLFASPRKSGTGTQVLPPMLLGSWKSRVQNMWLDTFIEAEYGLNRGRIPIEYDFRTHRPVFFCKKKCCSHVWSKIWGFSGESTQCGKEPEVLLKIWGNLRLDSQPFEFFKKGLGYKGTYIPQNFYIFIS